MKPRKVYWCHELLDYFIGTTDWWSRTNITNWISENTKVDDASISLYRITDYPYEDITPPDDVVDFISKSLEEFGQYDYEINPLIPCGGWKTLDILI